MARPRKEIDWAKFDALCRIHCTAEEIESVLGCERTTLWRACKRERGESFATLHEKLMGEGKASLRRMQLEAAKGGNVTMQIWLGKQLLGQKDKTELSGDENRPLKIMVEYAERAATEADGD